MNHQNLVYSYYLISLSYPTEKQKSITKNIQADEWFYISPTTRKESGRIMASDNSGLTIWANIIAFVLTFIVNGLAGSTTIIGGQETAQVSDANPTLITPAGYVFSIWGIIYLFLGVFVLYQALPSQKGKDFHKNIGWLFVLSCVANIIWLFFWQYEYLSLSVVLMFLLLASLTLIYLRLDIGKSKTNLRERLAVHLPFSVYLGWITIATIANISATLVSMNLDSVFLGVNAETWAILVIIVAVVIAVLVLATRKDLAYALVVIWALVGISAKQSGNQTIVLLTQISAIVVAIVLLATILLIVLRRKQP